MAFPPKPQVRQQFRSSLEVVATRKRRPGRPRVPKGAAEGKIVPIRFTQAEAEYLADAAKRNDQTLSEWIRHIVLGAVGI